MGIHLSPILLDSGFNNIFTVALNIFERILFQTFRLAALIKISSKWKALQNPKFVLTVIMNIAGRTLKLASNWQNQKLITFSLVQEDVQWLACKAFEVQWKLGKVNSRIQERKAIENLRKHFDTKTQFSQNERFSQVLLKSQKSLLKKLIN